MVSERNVAVWMRYNNAITFSEKAIPPPPNGFWRVTKGCFDHISHEWLLANIPVDKVILRKWLKCGYIFNKQMFPTEEGTPQGGIISPTLANMTLDGLQKILADRFKRRTIKVKQYSPMVNLVHYADDL